MLTSEDKQLLNRIQENFPVVSSPYAMIGEELGMTEQEVQDRISRLKQNGYIRRIGPFFNLQKLGYSSTLVAMRVPEDKIEAAALIINRYSGVTHNYIRSGKYNVWFTFIAPSPEMLQRALSDICARTGIDDILILPATHMFKVNVNLQIAEDEG